MNPEFKFYHFYMNNMCDLTWRSGFQAKQKDPKDILKHLCVLTFTHRLIVRQLQTGFVLHCSFAEVNSWEWEGEEICVSEAQQHLNVALKALNGPSFSHFILSAACLYRPTNHKGHWWCTVSELLLAKVLLGDFEFSLFIVIFACVN